MVENYMDYSNDACMNMYSANQSMIMRAIVELARPGLIEGQDDEECPLAGDVNTDGIMNIQDVIIVVKIVLGIVTDIDCTDINGDMIVNIQDIILIVSEILG